MSTYKDLQTVVQGEASESDEETELTSLPVYSSLVPSHNHNDSHKPDQGGRGTGNVADTAAAAPEAAAVDMNSAFTESGKMSMTQSLVIAGEASESDDEFQEVAAVSLSPSISGSLPALEVHREPEKVSQPPKPFFKKSTYDSLLHKKLCEKNKELAAQIEGYVKNMYSMAGRDISLITQQLAKSQSAIQDVSHNMRLATNDLFHLEDKLDIITSCDLLPEFTYIGGQRRYDTGATGSSMHSTS